MSENKKTLTIRDKLLFRYTFKVDFNMMSVRNKIEKIHQQCSKESSDTTDGKRKVNCGARSYPRIFDTSNV